MAIMVDANQTFTSAWPRGGPVWSYERALETAQELERLDVVWLEEPSARYDFEHLSRLCDTVSIYIAGGEGNKGLPEFKCIVDQNVYDVIQPDALYSEGISQLRKVAAMAEVAQKWFVPHNGISGVGMAVTCTYARRFPTAPTLSTWSTRQDVPRRSGRRYGANRCGSIPKGTCTSRKSRVWTSS